MTILHVLPLAAGAAVSPALLGASLEILHAFPRTRVRMLLAYLAGATALEPALWLDPLGPLVKILPSLLLTLAALAILDER